MPSAVDEAQVRKLSEQYGSPLRWKWILPVPPVGYTDWADRRQSKRSGEVMFVIPRPGGRYLAQTKTFYPERVFRIPTGGIHPEEDVADAFRREVREETGFQVEPARFLGVVDYEFRLQGRAVPFVTYILTAPQISGPPTLEDKEEEIDEFRDVSMEQVVALAHELEALAQPWTAWGQFRAVPHRMILAALTETGRARKGLPKGG